MSRWVLLLPNFFLSFLHFHFLIQNFLKWYVREPVGVCGWVGGYYSATASSASRRPLLQLCNRWKRKKEKCEHRIFSSNQVIFPRMHYSLVLVCSPSSVKVKAEKRRMVGCRSTRKSHNFKSETISLGNFLSWVSFFSHFFHLSA